MNDAVIPCTGMNRILLVTSAIVGSMVMEFAWTIAGVALPYMQGTFSATNDQIAWVMTAFVTGSSVMIVFVGWLSDRFGRKRLFALSIAAFTFSLVMCANADTLSQEVLWRFIQGASGAGLLPLGQAIVMDAYPSNQQSYAVSIWGNGVVLGGVMGPVIGGVIVEYYSWPWIFWLNVPIGLIALIGILFFVPETKNEPDRPLNWVGAGYLIIALVAIQLLANRGERLDWFESPEIILEAFIACLCGYLFISHSVLSERPFFRRELFKDWNFVYGQLFVMINGAFAILPLVLLPLLLQNVGGYPAISAGGLIIYRGIGLIIGLTITSRLPQHWDQRYLLASGFLLMCISGWGMSVWTVEISPFEVMWTNILQGISSAVVFVTVTTLTFSTLRSDLRTEGFAFFYALFFAGSAIGVAIIVTLQTRASQISHALLGEHVTQYRELFQFYKLPESWDMSELSGLGSLQKEIVLQSAMLGYNYTFFTIASVSLIAIPLVFLYRPAKLARVAQTYS